MDMELSFDINILIKEFEIPQAFFDRYKLIAQIGKGARGKVFKV